MDVVKITILVLGAGVAIALPVRLLLIRQWLPAFTRIGALPRVLAAIGIALLVPATLLWGYGLFVAYKVFLDPGVPRVWGGSELGMSLTAFALVYLGSELLCLPMTLRAHRMQLDQQDRSG